MEFSYGERGMFVCLISIGNPGGMKQPELLFHSVSPMWSKLFFVNYLSVLVDIGITGSF
jgi:hypothetical protein